MSDNNEESLPQEEGGYERRVKEKIHEKVMEKLEAKKLLNNELEKVVPKKTGRSWQGFQVRPPITFSTQNQDEVIYILSRSHWIVNVGWIFRNFLYSLLPLLLVFLIDLFSVKIPQGNVADKMYLIGILIFYSVILTNVVRDFYDWYFDPYLVTNERILDFTFNPFTNFSIIEAPLESVVSVKQDTRGIVAAVFNYGDVTVQTETVTQVITFEKASNPTRVRDIISDLSRVARTYSYGD